MPLKIEVTPDYRITSDTLNIIVQKRYTVDPTKSPNWPRMQAEGASPKLRTEWRDEGYYETLEGAVNGIIDRHLKESDAESLTELLMEIRKIRDKIREVLRIP
ncbi:hypothetical protein [Caldifermentibacillus hisashii]|uniref:hypothetical protein n=1 Tax=Caldifermentibacillus hisashii TaxID=996558 RepID=UPI0030E8E98F